MTENVLNSVESLSFYSVEFLLF